MSTGRQQTKVLTEDDDVGADKEIVTKLTESEEKLTKNNASLMAQLIDSTKINLEMSKKLNIKAAQGQDPKVKILADKANRKADFERNLYPTGYF